MLRTVLTMNDISSSNRICLTYEKNEHMNFHSHRHHVIKVKRESSFYSCRRTLVALIWLRKSRLILLNLFNRIKGLLLTAFFPFTNKTFPELDSVIIQYLILRVLLNIKRGIYIWFWFQKFQWIIIEKEVKHKKNLFVLLEFYSNNFCHDSSFVCYRISRRKSPLSDY